MSNSTPLTPEPEPGRSPSRSPLRLTEPEREQTARLLEEKGWRPYRATDFEADLVIGFAGYADRYCIYPPTPSARPSVQDTYLLSDRVLETAVFVEIADGPPTPRQAAEALREHGIPSFAMSPEQVRRGEPRVALSVNGKG